ncbi:MAG: helix-turn-helix domain-containing protein [Proteobacteria bacterium]|nr:MAG: helix-turn-helix domain-containing protein [Pseudomonadota bacterium]
MQDDVVSTSSCKSHCIIRYVLDTVFMVKTHLELAASDRLELERVIACHNVPVKVYRRAMGLLALAEGHTLQEAGKRAGVGYNSVAAWRDGYKEKGLTVLQDAPRSGRPVKFDGPQRASLTALACSAPPEGHGRWTITLLADKAVELGFVEAISRARVAVILKKTS